ncbi:3-dehydroquinate synthase [Candidatus Kapabacteria bacterium]|nr:3-dehydroquinate synthase [Candidatus Kapabacteria bacterium]
MKSTNTNSLSNNIIIETIDTSTDYNFDNSVIITDSNLAKIYPDFIKKQASIVIPFGEKSKSLESSKYIIDELIELGADRHTKIVAFGGGMILDLAAFAASVYMRGIEYTLIPTSLLAMVDASIGGKNGINYSNHKNIIGTFNQAEKIIINQKFLETLPDKEWKNGFAEIIKIALVSDYPFFEYLEKNIINSNLKNLDPKILHYILTKSVYNKCSVVNKDEKEKNLRKILNFGHTFGHAIELYFNLDHGMSVALGIIIASKVSVKMGLIKKDDSIRIHNLIKRSGLPTDIQMNENIIESINLDKKKNLNEIDFILLNEIGEAIIHRLEIDKLKSHVLQGL